MTTIPENQLEFFLALAIVHWSSPTDTPQAAAQSVASILVNDWDCTEATRAYVLTAAAEMHAQRHNKSREDINAAYRALDDFGPDEVAENLERCIAERAPATSPADQSLIDKLIQQTNLYSTSASFVSLLAFVAKMRGFAPFNAMLLHAQKPGVTHAATAADWQRRFNRTPKPDARPLIVMQAMGPVGFVFDFQDTEGAPLPPEAFAFPTFGNLSEARLAEMVRATTASKIEVIYVDHGDAAAGSITRKIIIVKGRERPVWTIRINKNHGAKTQFVTFAHELAHLFLGHLGADDARGVKLRTDLEHDRQEVEAETVAWVVAHRNGLKPRSEAYLDKYKTAFKGLDIGTVLRAANAVETVMGISAAQLAKAAQVGAKVKPLSK